MHAHRPVGAVGEELVVDPARHAAEGLARRVARQARVGLGERRVGVREPVELEVVVLAHAVDPLVEHEAERLLALDRVQHEPRHELQRHLDEHAERAEADAHRRQQLGAFGLAHGDELPRAGHQLRGDDLRREAAEREARAVRAGRRRARDGLPVDVAHVLHGEAVGRQQLGESVQPRPGGERHPAGRDIRVHDARQVGEVELHAGRHRDAGEAVARPDGLDGQAGCRGGGHRPLHRARRRGPLHPLGPHRLGAGPVAPRRSARRHRNAFPSPR